MAKKVKQEEQVTTDKKAYSYNPVTREFTGESIADESPLEPGVFLIPAYATEIAPPEKVEGKFRAFNGTAWEYKDIENTTTE